MNISDKADVYYLLHGGGVKNCAVNGTVYMSFTDATELGDMSDYLYVNGGNNGSGIEGSRDIYNGKMETYAVVNNVVITATNSKIALFGAGGSGSTKVNSATVNMTNCNVEVFFIGGINGELQNCDIYLDGCTIGNFAGTNRGFVGSADVNILDCDIDTFEAVASAGCFTTDSGTPDGSGVTGSVNYTIDANSTIANALLTPTVTKTNDAVLGELNNVSIQKTGEPIELEIATFKAHASNEAQNVTDYIIPNGSLVTLDGANVEVTSGQSLTNMGTLALDSDKAINVASGATFNDGGVTNAVVTGEGTTHKYVAKIGNTGYDSLETAVNEAVSGNVIELLNDVEIDAALAIPAGVTLDGNDFTIEASEAFSGSYLINLNNGDLSNVKIMDVVLDGNNKASILLKVGDGAVCSGLTVSGVTFKNASHGVYLGNDSGSHNGADNISFTDCTFENLSYAGIYAQRGNIAVDQCKFQNIASASSTAAGVLFDTGYFDNSAYSLSVTNSTFTNITGTSSNEKATGGVSITGTGTVSKLTVTGNTFSGNTIDIRLGKTTAPVITDANIAGNGIVNIVAAPGVGLYTAKFYSNNALVATVVSDETGKITIPAAPSNSGYIFLGWRSGDATYKAGEVVTISADTTFVAVWGNLPDVKPSEPSEPETPVFPFYDVTARDWYYSAVKYVYEKGLMDGVDVGVFAPNDTLTRAMVWTIIARAEGVDTTGGATWYAKAQEWVTAKGISDGENPNAAITRQELVTMLYRLAGEPAVSGTITAPDASSVSTWAQSAMTWAMNIGLVEGDENGAVTPTATATRAQAAALIMRYLEA